jgi:sugar (pentulose or hexulose) kinase
MSFIGIDLGGTFIKSAILDVDSIQIKHARRHPFPDFEPGPAYERVVSPEKILSAFHALLDEMLLLEPTCEGLLLSGQMHGMIFCDAQGTPKSQFITWQDHRATLPFDSTGKSVFDHLKETLFDWDWRILGNELRPGIPLTQLFFLKHQNALPENLYCASIMDFVIANLCKTPPVTDSTNAEAHGLYNVVNGAWDFQLIQKLNFDKINCPEIKPHFTVIGTFARQKHEIPCYVASGDQQCALLGSFLKERELSLNIATGSQASLLSDSCELGDYQTRPYFEGKYLKTITHIPAGRALNALVRLFTEIPAPQTTLDAVWEYIQKEVSKLPTADLDVKVTFFSGPLGDHGYISNMRESNMTLGNVFFAAFNNMADNYHQCALRLSPGQGWDRIIFSGGLVSKIPALQKIIVQKFDNVSWKINEQQEDVLLGLLVIAVKIRNQESLLESQKTVRNSVRRLGEKEETYDQS